MGLADILTPRISELGKIKIGRKSDEVRKTADGRDWSPPQKLDAFLITTLNRDAKKQLEIDTKLMNELIREGCDDKTGKLRRLPIRLLSNDPEDVMQSAFCWYAGRSIGARSDGKNVTWFVDPVKRVLLPEPRVEPWTDAHEAMTDSQGNKLFKSHTVFNCVIASAASRFGGVHKFRTTSAITGSQLYGGLLHILQLTNGVLMGLPLQLVVRPLQVNPTVKGKQQSSTVYVVHVELIGSDLQAIQEQAQKQAKWALSSASTTQLAIAQYRQLLRAPGHEATDLEVLDISDEFHPEVNERAEVKMPVSTDDPEPPEDPDPPPETPQVEQPEAEPDAQPEPESDKRMRLAQTVCKMLGEAGDEDTLKAAWSMLPSGWTKVKDAATELVATQKEECKLRLKKDEIDQVLGQFDAERQVSIAKSVGITDMSQVDTFAKAQKLLKAAKEAVETSDVSSGE